MSSRLIILIFVLVCVCSKVWSQTSLIDINTSQQSLDLTYKKIKRLSAGIPLIENHPLGKTILSETSDRFVFGSDSATTTVYFRKSKRPNVVGIYLSKTGLPDIKGNEYQGIFFSEVPGYKRGVALFRYKPWNAWTKPVVINKPGELEPWDNQCFYWQYDDGVYGVAVPISDLGYRTTLGSVNSAFGSKAVSHVDGFSSDSIPCMAVGFGDNLYSLLNDVYTSASEWMKIPGNMVSKKKFPEPLEYIGWCTWNASSQGTKLNEETVAKSVETFSKNNFPLGWVLIDDGWFDHNESRMRSFQPDRNKFPRGFSPLVNRLKKEYNVRHVGIWHTLNGYWNGIDPESELGKKYRDELFAWTQNERPDKENPKVTHHFIKPGSDSLKTFYSRWHTYLKSEGITFLKVDNQLVVERMSVNNYPIGSLARAMHSALNESAHKYFDDALINCMDMTSDAYYNFGTTAVARSVEDYFPYRPRENYNLQHGNAAAHVIQGVYNNLYFSQMVFPDLDMFQSHNPNAVFHAIARAINNGPIYITDNAGEQNFDLLRRLILDDGRILRADQALLPSEDCLFQVQSKKPFKAFSRSHGIGLLGVWNCADTSEVTGWVSANDVQLKGEKFAFYERFSNKLTIGNATLAMPVKLSRLGYQLYYVAKLENEMSPLGILDKYNAPATIDQFTISKSGMKVVVKGAGKFGAVLPAKPKKVLVDGKRQTSFSFDNGLFAIEIHPEANKKNHVIVITL